MFRTFGIEQDLPRDIKTLNANLYEGLQLSNTMGYLLVIVGIICLIAAIFKTKMLLPYLVIAAVIAIGVWLLSIVKSTHDTRRNCFEKGALVEAKVIRHGQHLGKYTVSLEVNGESREVSHASTDLWPSCPLGTIVLGLKDQNNYFFGPEIGCRFTVFLKK